MKTLSLGFFILSTVLMFFVPPAIIAADSLAVRKEIDSLRSELVKVKADMNSSYYMVGKESFMGLVKQEVYNNLFQVIGILGGILGILGFFGVKEVSERMKKNVQATISSSIEAEYKKIEEKYSTLKDEQLNFNRKYSLMIAMDQIFNSPERYVKYDLNLEKLNNYLSEIVSLGDDEIGPIVADKFFVFMFNFGKYDDLNKMREKYEERISFNYITWANIAIGTTLLFAASPSAIYRDNALSACKMSLKALPDYGTAHALMLIIHSIDYERSTAENQEQPFLSAKQLLYNLIKSDAVIMPAEVYHYFERNKGKTLYKYVDGLFKMFPEEMAELKKIYENDVQRNPGSYKS
jgi:hypothetical protein